MRKRKKETQEEVFESIPDECENMARKQERWCIQDAVITKCFQGMNVHIIERLRFFYRVVVLVKPFVEWRQMKHAMPIVLV